MFFPDRQQGFREARRVLKPGGWLLFNLWDRIDRIPTSHAVVAGLQRRYPAHSSWFLGFAIRTEAGENPLPGPVGSFYWTEAYGATFYVDPRQKLIIILMIQVPLGSQGGTYRHAVRSLAYQVLTSPD